MTIPPLLYFDALYGDVELPLPIGELARTPVVQRLRDIRLSNIDSLAMPGISNLSRFEHALGSAHLALSVQRGSRLTETDSIALAATAILHDAAISGFGHLVEEALQYAGTGFDHEKKLEILLSAPDKIHLGGVDLQIFQGRQAGLQNWAVRSFGNDAQHRLREMFEGLHGAGRWGRLISGGLDLDNLDNLVRIAYHMGLPVDRELPVTIARNISLSPFDDEPVFSASALSLIEDWLKIRHSTYSRLMLSRVDFVGKSMLLFAIITAYRNGDLGLREQAWNLTDRQILDALLSSANPDVVKTVQSWLLYELWPLSELLWFEGTPPSFPDVLAFCEIATAAIRRPCFAYRINDKRVRRLRLRIEGGSTIEVGSAPAQWLLGISSRKRDAFTRAENERLKETAHDYFGCSYLGSAVTPEAIPALFG